jgi:hypothetical protein
MDYRGKSIQQHPHIVDTNENSGDEEYWSENLSTGSQIILLPLQTFTFTKENVSGKNTESKLIKFHRL